MDSFIRAAVYEHDAYLLTAMGDVYHLRFGGDRVPVMERLTPEERQQLRGLQLRYDVWG